MILFTNNIDLKLNIIDFNTEKTNLQNNINLKHNISDYNNTILVTNAIIKSKNKNV